jgi:hypothetical protein
MDYKVSLSVEYTNFCIIIYLNLFPTMCTYNFKIFIIINYIPTCFGGGHHHHTREGPPSQAKTRLLETILSGVQSHIYFVSPINTEHDERRCVAPIKPAWTVESQDIEVGTCTIFGTMATVQLHLQLYNTQSQN